MRAYRIRLLRGILILVVGVTMLNVLWIAREHETRGLYFIDALALIWLGVITLRRPPNA